MLRDVTAVNEAVVGSLYSQLTGVLAGFAFVGLTLIITRQFGSRPTSGTTADDLPCQTADSRRQAYTDEAADRSALLLFAAFLGLTVSSLGYAIIGGQENFRLAAVQHVILGVGFSTAALLLLLALREMLWPVAAAAYRFAHRVVAYGFPLAAILYVGSGAWDALRRLEADTVWSPLMLLGAALLGAAIAVGGITTLRRVRVTTLAARRRRPDPYSWAAGASVTLALVASLCVPVLDGAFGHSETAPLTPVWLAVAAVGSVAAAFIWLCRRTRQEPLTLTPVAPVMTGSTASIPSEVESAKSPTHPRQPEATDGDASSDSSPKA